MVKEKIKIWLSKILCRRDRGKDVKLEKDYLYNVYGDEIVIPPLMALLLILNLISLLFC